jgi:CRP/FNR family transcriptional regulator, cyclic AMP receptor protein
MVGRSDLSVLGERGWLSVTAPDFCRSVLEKVSLRKFSAGEAIFRAGDPPGGLWGLVDGAVQIELQGRVHVSKLVHVATPGFWFGEGPVILTSPRRVTVYTTRQSTLASLSLHDCRHLLESDTASWRWIALLSALSRDLSLEAAADLLERDPRRRVVATLLRLSGHRVGTYLPSLPVPVTTSQQELARMANLSRTVVNEILRDLEKQRLIRVHYRRMEVVDEAGLKQLLVDD